MAKQIGDDRTVDMLPGSAKRGRPVTGKAKTGAERQRDFRRRQSDRPTYAQIVAALRSAHVAIDKALDLTCGMWTAFPMTAEKERAAIDQERLVLAEESGVISYYLNRVDGK